MTFVSPAKFGKSALVDIGGMHGSAGSAKASATRLPMPCAAAVMRTVFPVRSVMGLGFLVEIVVREW